MMGLEKTSGGKTFATIVGGKIRVKVEEGTEGAERREYKTPAGVEGVKHELVYDRLSGVIKNISISEKEWGKMIDISIDGVNLSLNVDTKYAQSIMERLPAIKIDQELQIVPYDFEPEGKKRTGVNIYQGEKINSYYRDGKKALNGFPTPDNNGEGFDKDDWKIFFTQVKKFLVTETEKFIEKNIPEIDQQITEKDTDEINIENIQF